MAKILITAYNSPDLDGSASAYAYAELLIAQGKSVVWGIFGNLHPEAEFVFDKLAIRVKNAKFLVGKSEEIYLVDASDVDYLPKGVKIDKVSKVIDHRKVNTAEAFAKAKIQIEFVGSCATLIAEKFIESEIKPSKESAVLLYCAIISNTINFTAKVTTNRDHQAARFLQSQTKIDKNIIHQMFAHKSKIDGPIKAVLAKDLARHIFDGKKVCVFQLEIINIGDFIKKNLEEIKLALQEFASENLYDHTFLTCIDIEEGNNTFVAADKKSEEIVSGALGVKFKNGIARYPHVIMRKEILPKVKKYLESNQSKSRYQI